MQCHSIAPPRPSDLTMRREALQSSASHTQSPRRRSLPKGAWGAHYSLLLRTSTPRHYRSAHASLSHGEAHRLRVGVGAFRVPKLTGQGRSWDGWAPSPCTVGRGRHAGESGSVGRCVRIDPRAARILSAMDCATSHVRSLCLRRFMMMVALFMRMKKPTSSNADKPGSSSSHSGNEPPPPAIQ